MASDGTVQSNFMEPKKNQLFTSILNNDWIKFCPLFKRKEEHSGWMIYSYRSGRYFVCSTNKYKLSVNEMIQYLIDYSFVSFGYYVPYYYSSPDIPVVI